MSTPPPTDQPQAPIQITLNQASITRENDERFQSIFQPVEYDNLAQNLFRPSFILMSDSIVGGTRSVVKCSPEDVPGLQIPFAIHSIPDLTKRLDNPLPKSSPEKPTFSTEKSKKPAETKQFNGTVENLLNFCKQDFDSEEEIPIKLEEQSEKKSEGREPQMRFFSARRRPPLSESPLTKNVDFETFVNALEQKSAFKVVFRCQECPEKEFRSKQALGGHQGQVHRGQSLQYARRIKIKKQNNQTRLRHAFLKRLKAPGVDEQSH